MVVIKEEPHVTRTFRITKEQDGKLELDHPNKASMLVRALLDMYFKGLIKDVKVEHKF